MPTPPDPGRTAWIDQLNDYGRRITALENQIRVEPLRIVGAAGQPAFLNGWAQYGGFSTVGFWKDPFGQVFVQGLTQGGTVGLPIFTLPVGYRPPNAAYQILFATLSNAALGRVDVTPGGDVTLTTGSNAWASLDPIHFRAAF